MNNVIKNQSDECGFATKGVIGKRRNIFICCWEIAYRCAYRWNERRKAANTLARLNSDKLNDIGLTRDDIKRDYSRPFWR